MRRKKQQKRNTLSSKKWANCFADAKNYLYQLPHFFRQTPFCLVVGSFFFYSILDSKHAMFWSENILRFGLPLYFGFELIAKTK